MTARVLDGRAIARDLIREARDGAEEIRLRGEVLPSIVVVRVGDDPALVQYAVQLEKGCLRAGFGYRRDGLPLATDTDTLVGVLQGYAADPAITGIVLQFPLPKSIDALRASEAVDRRKDIDGVNPTNLGHLFTGAGEYFAPATPLGGIELLQRAGIEIAGKRAVVVGRSAIVGRPLAMLLLRENATVTIGHSRTPDLGSITRQAEILAVAAGRPGLITGDMVAPGAVVLDFGINEVGGKLVGDVNYDSVAAVASAITPVPGGTGPMTVAMLLQNALTAARHGRGEGKREGIVQS